MFHCELIRSGGDSVSLYRAPRVAGSSRATRSWLWLEPDALRVIDLAPPQKTMPLTGGAGSLIPRRNPSWANFVRPLA